MDIYEMRFLKRKETYDLDLRVLKRVLSSEGFRTTETSKDRIIRIHYKGDILDGDQYKIAEILGSEIIISNGPTEERKRLENLLKRLDEGRYP